MQNRCFDRSVASPPGGFLNGVQLEEASLGALEAVRVLTTSGHRFCVHHPQGGLPPERQLPFATLVTRTTPSRT